MGFLPAVIAIIALLPFGLAQFPPTPENVTTIKSKYNSEITISYKEVRLIADEGNRHFMH